MDLDLKFAEIESGPSCVTEALESIIHSCEVPENVMDRARISIRLSICEFAVAGIDFPPLCFDPLRTTQCTQLLESKPTWWTTYSGNYQNIAIICQEFQPQLETKRAIQVYKNLTNLMNDYNTQQTDSLQIAASAIQYIQTQWQELQQNFISGTQNAQQGMADLELEIREAQIGAALHFTQISSVLNSTLAQLQHQQELSLAFNDTVSTFQDRFSDFEDGMSEIQIQHLMTANVLKASVERTSDVLDATNETLEGSARVIEAIAGIFQVLKFVFAGLWPVMLVVGATWLIRKTVSPWRTHKIANTRESPCASNPDEIELDPLFY